MPYFSVYAASKAFVLSFSEALSAENRDYGVDVPVCPGPTETNFFKKLNFPTVSECRCCELSHRGGVREASNLGKKSIVVRWYANQLTAIYTGFATRIPGKSVENHFGTLEKKVRQRQEFDFCNFSYCLDIAG